MIETKIVYNMRRFFFPLMLSVALAFSCNAPESPVDSKPEGHTTSSSDPDASKDPGASVDPGVSEDPSVDVNAKVILNGTEKFESFAVALEAARKVGAESSFKLAKGTLEENILIDPSVTFPVSIEGESGAVLDGSIEISKAQVSIKGITIKPQATKIALPALEMKDDRNNWPFAVLVHDAKYGFNMENVTIDITSMVSADSEKDASNATAVVLRGETIGSKDVDVVRGCTILGNSQRLMQTYDAQVNLLGNTFMGFYQGYAVRVGEDDGTFDNTVGPTVTLAGNNFIADAADAAVNFHSLSSANVVFGNGENDTNRKSEGVVLMYNVNAVPGENCVFKPETLVDDETMELYFANDNSMPEAIEMWAYRVGDAWWTTAPLPGIFQMSETEGAGIKDLGGNWLRSIAMDDRNVYLARTIMDENNEGIATHIYYFPIEDPTKVGTLPMPEDLVKDLSTAAASGLWVVDNADGTTNLLFCNIARENSAQLFKVWKYDNLSTAPTLLVSQPTGGGYRLGDKMSYNGTMADGEVMVTNYYSNGRIWIYPVKNGTWTGEEVRSGFLSHPGSSMSAVYRYFDSNEFLHCGSMLQNKAKVFERSEVTEFTETFGAADGQFDGMIHPNFFKFGRSAYMAFASLAAGGADKYYAGTVRLVRLDKKKTLAENLAELNDESGSVLPLGQTTVTSPLTQDTNPNGNHTADCVVRAVGGNTYILASDCNNALVLYRLKK